MLAVMCRRRAPCFRTSPSWCAFVDPSRSLYAPGVERAGVRLSHLLVVRPRPEDLVRVTLRLVESQSLPLVIVDLVGHTDEPTGRSARALGAAW